MGNGERGTAHGKREEAGKIKGKKRREKREREKDDRHNEDDANDENKSPALTMDVITSACLDRDVMPVGMGNNASPLLLRPRSLVHLLCRERPVSLPVGGGDAPGFSNEICRWRGRVGCRLLPGAGGT